MKITEISLLPCTGKHPANTVEFDGSIPTFVARRQMSILKERVGAHIHRRSFSPYTIRIIAATFVL